MVDVSSESMFEISAGERFVGLTDEDLDTRNVFRKERQLAASW